MSTIAYCCPFVPGEWIAAHGHRPYRITPSAESAEQEAFAGVCPFAAAFAGAALGCGEAGGIVLTTVCDQMRRMADWVEPRSGRPVFLMNVPATWQTPVAREIYAGELRRLGRFLVQLGGQAPSREMLIQCIVEHDATRASFHEAARKPARPGIRLALIGGPLLREDIELFQLVERMGGQVVLDGTEAGERTMPAPLGRDRLDADPFAELVRIYFGSIPDPFRRPDNLLHDWLGHEIAARGVRGVIVHRYVWCDHWHAQMHRLKETLKMPVLDLDSAGDGRAGRARMLTRLQAFVETLA